MEEPPERIQDDNAGGQGGPDLLRPGEAGAGASLGQSGGDAARDFVLRRYGLHELPQVVNLTTEGLEAALHGIQPPAEPGKAELQGRFLTTIRHPRPPAR